jgi:hypothetical protein
VDALFGRFVRLKPGATYRLVLGARRNDGSEATALADEFDQVSISRVRADLAEALIEREDLSVRFPRDLGWVEFFDHDRLR